MSARATDNLGAAIAIYLLALFLFDAMGLIIKHLSPRYTAAELSVWRNLFGLLPSFIALYATSAWRNSGRKIVIRQWRLAVFRGLIVAIAQLLYYLSLGALAFAIATTISFSVAIFMTVLAVPILGEKVGWVRWSAVAIGFIGVLLVARPTGATFEWIMLAPIFAAFFYALTGVLARLFDDDVPSPLANVYSNVLAFFGSLVLVMFWGGFSPLQSVADIGWLVAMGTFGGLAVLCLVVSFRMTEQSNLAPFSYFGIPVAFALGWVFFNEAPFDALFPGALLIIAGGILVVLRERQLRNS